MYFIITLNFLAILNSGYCVRTELRQKSIELDTDITVRFFESQFRKYANNPEIVCKLVFVMQCIQDYHPGFERDFNSIDGQTFSYITGLYASLTTRETNIFICRSLPGGRQLNGRTLNQAEYYSDDEQLQDNQRFPVESELGAVISNWIQFYVQDYHSNIDNGPAIQNLEQVYSPEYQFNPALRYHLDRWTSGAIFGFRDSSVFKSYRIMKVFIIQHAMSLGSRGRRSRDRWRLAAAQSMAELDLHRFFACEAIKLSLFQRRQKPIRMDEDNDYARRVLNEVQTWSMWEHHITPNRFTPRLADRLTNLRDPTWFPHPATFRFPSTLSLYNIVSVNFQIYVNDAVSYVNHLQNQQRSRFGAAYASLIKLLIRYIWGIVQNPLRFFPLYNGNVDRLIASTEWESTWWRDQPVAGSADLGTSDEELP